MDETNKLVLATHEEEDAADNLLVSLSNIAYSAEPVSKAKKRKSHRSRFFFRISDSIATEVKKKRKVFKPKEMVHVDAEVEQRLKVYKQEIPAELSQNIDEVREFFLREIAPITMATGAGSSQAKEVVKRLLGSDVDNTQFEKFERMTQLAVNIKMARFVSRRFGMTKKEARDILEAMIPRPPTLIPIPQGAPNGRQGKTQGNKKANNSK